MLISTCFDGHSWGPLCLLHLGLRPRKSFLEANLQKTFLYVNNYLVNNRNP